MRVRCRILFRSRVGRLQPREPRRFAWLRSTHVAGNRHARAEASDPQARPLRRCVCAWWSRPPRCGGSVQVRGVREATSKIIGRRGGQIRLPVTAARAAGLTICRHEREHATKDSHAATRDTRLLPAAARGSPERLVSVLASRRQADRQSERKATTDAETSKCPFNFRLTWAPTERHDQGLPERRTDLAWRAADAQRGAASSSRASFAARSNPLKQKWKKALEKAKADTAAASRAATDLHHAAAVGPRHKVASKVTLPTTTQTHGTSILKHKAIKARYLPSGGRLLDGWPHRGAAEGGAAVPQALGSVNILKLALEGRVPGLRRAHVRARLAAPHAHRRAARRQVRGRAQDRSRRVPLPADRRATLVHCRPDARQASDSRSGALPRLHVIRRRQPSYNPFVRTIPSVPRFLLRAETDDAVPTQRRAITHEKQKCANELNTLLLASPPSAADLHMPRGHAHCLERRSTSLIDGARECDAPSQASFALR